MTKRTACRALALAIGVAAIGLSLPSPVHASDDVRGVLATSDQLALEAIALRVLASAPLRQQVARLEQLYRQDPQGATPAGKATIRRAVDSIAMAAVQYVVNGDPSRPAAMWAVNAPHRWFGLDVPRSGYGIDNPDNVYRNIPIDGASRYEIRGKISQPGPIEQHFAIMDAIPGTRPMTAEGGTMVATLRSDQLAIAPDGSFTITIDNAPANGRPNHMQTLPEGRLHMVVRDLFTDWSTQSPVALEVRRISGPPLLPPPSETELAQRAAELLAKIGPYWLAYDNRFVFTKPANQVTSPRSRPGGRGFATSGWFNLAADEALVVTLDPLGATSLGFQLADPWGVAYEYATRTSSLNTTQARPNEDGTFTFVISARDPGVYNWLDPEGFNAGIYAIRWQGLPEGTDPQRAVREVRLAGVDKLKDVLPAGASFVSAEQRSRQRSERARAYSKRLFQ